MTMLSVQYRMHPKISKWISRYFYNDQLQDGPNIDRCVVLPSSAFCLPSRHSVCLFASTIRCLQSCWCALLLPQPVHVSVGMYLLPRNCVMATGFVAADIGYLISTPSCGASRCQPTLRRAIPDPVVRSQERSVPRRALLCRDRVLRLRGGPGGRRRRRGGVAAQRCGGGPRVPAVQGCGPDRSGAPRRAALLQLEVLDAANARLLTTRAPALAWHL